MLKRLVTRPLFVRVGHLSAVVMAALVVAQCKTPGEAGEFELQADTGQSAADGVMALPTLVDPDEYMELVEAEIPNTVPAAKKAAYAKRIAHYMGFLGHDPGDAITKTILKRIMDSSTQFILCDSFEDWACLEATPLITPGTKMRKEGAAQLGEPLAVAEPLKIEGYFTDAWDIEKENITPHKMLAHRLAEKINKYGEDGIDVAIYGIDESKGSMKPVFDALLKRAQAKKVRAVVDTLDFRDEVVNFPQVFSYKQPSSTKAWIFDPLTGEDDGLVNLRFQYKDTVKLIHAMNKGITDDDQARARVEWPNGNGIMHNKFLVFRDGDDLRVWTGTANVADTCMGTERNTNVGIFIDNDEVAQAFADEFEEMFGYREMAGGDKLLNAKGGEAIKVGRFHTQKTPNTKRYFTFKDGSELRVHFAPTDDGEHRAIIPMLLSAKKGDVIRVAMFGAGGQEFVRAFQYAAAKGADVRIVLDRLTGSQTVGWLRDKAGNLLDENPYDATPSGKLVVRRSTWKKQNHHKSATLTRQGGQPEVIIIGSQNWSKQGNDVNDENMVTIRRLASAVPMGEEFNEHFDKRLWKVAADGELKVGMSYTDQVGASAEADEAAEE